MAEMNNDMNHNDRDAVRVQGDRRGPGMGLAILLLTAILIVGALWATGVLDGDRGNQNGLDVELNNPTNGEVVPDSGSTLDGGDATPQSGSTSGTNTTPLLR